MFDIGFGELLILALIGLLVLGPQRLPKVAYTLGQLSRKARTSWNRLRTELESELNTQVDSGTVNDLSELKQLREELNISKRELNKLTDISQPTSHAAASNTSNKPSRKALDQLDDISNTPSS